MSKNTKFVTWRNLEKGQKIRGWQCDGSHRMASAIVKDTNPAVVTLLVFGKTEEEVDSEANMFEVDMTEDEIHAQYEKAAAEIIKNIQIELPISEIGEHEMWNGWISCDAYEMAMALAADSIKVVGHCTEIVPKHAMFSNDLLDVGICIEYDDKERCWCHARSSDIDNILENWEYAHKKQEQNT